MSTNRFSRGSGAYLRVLKCQALTALFCLLSLQNLSAQCDFICISQVNVSLDQNCQATISPTSLISNPLGYAESDFQLVLTDEHGDNLLTNEVSIDLVDQNLTYELFSTTSGCNLTCWGRVLIEDKFLPVIECLDDITLDCGGLDVLPLPEVSGGSDCIEAAFDIFLSNEVRRPIDCDDPGFEDYTHVVTRTYTATDGNGNDATCEQSILIKRPDLNNIHLPTGVTTISCSDFDNYLFYDNEGVSVPLPWVTATGSGTGSGSAPGIVFNAGVPFICDPNGLFTTIGFCNAPNTGSGTGTPLVPQGGATVLTPDGPELINSTTAIICNAVVHYTDLVVPGSDCRRKIFRTWEIREWWCGNEFSTPPSAQMIELIDDVAPEITCPADMTVTTNDECGGMVDLPMAEAYDECSSGVTVRTSFPNGLMDTNGGPGMLNAGVNLVTYTVSDGCENTNSCTVSVTVSDLTAPVAICESSTVVSITQTGQGTIYASAFDDGSWDECGIATMEARRMTETCTPDNAVLGPYVTFCCEDVGNEVMVVFRVTDLGGNFTECMVSVEVQDKTAPSLACPKDLTVACTTVYAEDNLSLAFGEAVVTDNCAQAYVPTETVDTDLNQCSVGSIVRNFSLDHSGTQVISCKQRITFVDLDPFTAADIVWPTNLYLTNMDRCSLVDLLPDNLDSPHDYPSLPTQDDHCSLLGFDYTDVITGQGACQRIVRTWRVIDWCTQVNNQFVIYTNPTDQIIEISDNTVPQIQLTADPITFSSSSSNCLNTDIDVSATAPNVCQEALLWTWIIRDNAGTALFQGTGSRITQSLVAATYTIDWAVTTGCGVIGSATQSVIVENLKAPVPVCMNGMIVELVGGTATLTSEMINVGSYSPCNNPVDVSFSAGNINDDSLPFGCSDVGAQNVNLYVTDLVNGQSDFCIADVTIVDNDPNTPCTPGVNRVVVSGEVYTEDFLSVEDVEVSMAVTMPYAMTDHAGTYAFDDMPMGGSYEIVPAKNTDHLNGVSTLDLILIQRHILGIEQLATPYQLIAADVDNNHTINGIDLVELRKLILGVYTELPNNTSWRFVDALYNFVDELNPWASKIEESYRINALDQDMDIDFIGVKVGDVNGSVVTNSIDNPVDSRAQRWPLVLTAEDAKLSNSQSASIPILAQNYERISGWQGTLRFDASKVKVLGVTSDYLDKEEAIFDLSKVDAGYLTFSIGHLEPTDYKDGSELFRIEVVANEATTLSSTFLMVSDVTSSEAYRGLNEIVPLKMAFTTDDSINEIYSAVPNPWIEQTTLEYYLAKEGQINWEFYSADGVKLYSTEDYSLAGRGSLTVKLVHLNYKGVIYVKMISGSQLAEFKMIKF